MAGTTTDEGHDTDDSGAPRIKRVSSRIAALERRAEYLETQIDEGNGSRGALDFDRAELKAIQAGILALRYHRADVEGLDQPMLALQELVEALSEEQSGRTSEMLHTGRAVDAFRRARVLMLEWG